ncbi:hypothetical protein CS0771_07850 [Catellatospora sp. IY07-71]|uniref:carboxypeptidase-like regulatory domain-containing protein n=1 Tax=Catellatospora sp. IY07-71 TaxID=2728827 RepID=UPI001BB3A0EA|nr:carboxypeptidase-like regulatory domain-containing protein [Catellatospora sp. IY07-71]BCJ71241.1 hypothetical protein CS0771_07850 [Catellatospora sp. IY07-71]
MRARALAALALSSAAVVIPSSTAQAVPQQAAPAAAPVTAQAAAPLTGVITGKVTDGAGAPLPGACVTAVAASLQTLGRACAGDDGRYRIDNARNSVIYLRADAGGHTTWAPDRLDRVTATHIGVTTGETVTVDLVVEQRHGMLRGTVSRQDGTPAKFANVSLYREGAPGTRIGMMIARDGAFTWSLPVGRYLVSYGGSGYNTTEWHPGVPNVGAATAVEITENGTVEIAERFLPADPMPPAPTELLHRGYITAQPDGAPVAGATVSLYSQSLVHWGTVQTAADGEWRLPLPSDLRLITTVSAPGYATVWGFDDPEPMIGQVMLPPTRLRPGSGGLRVTVRDHDGGSLVPTATALLKMVDTGYSWDYTLPVRFDGTIDLPNLPAGRYKLKITPAADPIRATQWYPAALDEASAEVITVSDGQTTELATSLLGPGRVEVKVVDAVTGAPIKDACMSIADVDACTDADGIRRADVGWEVKKHSLQVEHLPYHFTTTSSFDAKPGQLVKVTVPMQPGAVVAAAYEDKTGHDGSSGVCVDAVRGVWGDVIAEDDKVCGSLTPGNKVLLGPFHPGRVQLFVHPTVTTGAQWLGHLGGTGDRRTAATLDLHAGFITTAPNIVALGYGRIDGRIQFPNGDDALFGCAEVAPRMSSCAEDGGYFSIPYLGPYTWTLTYQGGAFYRVRTGEAGAPGNFTVKVGQSTPAWVKLIPGTSVYNIDNGNVNSEIDAFDAYTGRLLYSTSGGTLALPANRIVVFRLRYGSAQNPLSCWAHLSTRKGSTPYYMVGTEPLSPFRIDPAKNCLNREPVRLTGPVAPLPGPVPATMFAAAPAGSAGTSTAVTGGGAASPWGVPTAARLARVKP